MALQTWLQLIQSLAREAVVVEREYQIDDLRRTDLGRDIERCSRDFPWYVLIILGSGVGVLSLLSLVAAARSSIPFLFSGTPTLVMLLIFVGSSYAARFRGRRWTREALELLGFRP